MIILHYVTRNRITTTYFDSITDAYKYYVKHCASIQEWLYYLYHAHTLLNKVTDEEIMKCLFIQVFKRGLIERI